MKTILVPFEESDVVDSVLETSCLAAKRFGSYVEGVYVQPALPAIASADGFGVVTPAFVEKYELEDRARIQEAENYFNEFMKQRGVASQEPETPGDQASAVWQNVGPSEDYVGHRGRLFDLIAVGRPLQGTPVPSMHTLESALFESGRPILIAPPTPPQKMGETVVISWNGSTETARTISFAMPFLRQAATVFVVSIVDDMVPGPSGQDIVRHLKRNGIAANAVDAQSNKRDIGEAMLGEAMAQGADLIVKGAYTHSRLRQMIFGGATSHMLAHAEVPILMAH
ncbi:MAG: universal stress protein [Rhodospirillaceae bacterium]|jgi:nucleotide-binding universal stress UspA family protein|nr:universal stress protein [Rhodospirillaceae bacterium]MBT5812699.1 universal stress protein [Rhodospirillaceae bacterium]